MSSTLHAAEDARQLSQHLDFARRSRREVGMPAFGRARHEPAVHVVQQRLAEPGARRDHGRIPFGMRHATLQHRQFVRLEHGHAVGERFEVVQHVGAPEPEPFRDRRAVHEPGHVREPGDLVGHRPRDAEARRLDVPRLRPGAI